MSWADKGLTNTTTRLKLQSQCTLCMYVSTEQCVLHEFNLLFVSLLRCQLMHCFENIILTFVSVCEPLLLSKIGHYTAQLVNVVAE